MRAPLDSWFKFPPLAEVHLQVGDRHLQCYGRRRDDPSVPLAGPGVLRDVMRVNSVSCVWQDFEVA